jgi:hypothetical protein
VHRSGIVDDIPCASTGTADRQRETLAAFGVGYFSARSKKLGLFFGPERRCFTICSSDDD